MIWRIGERDAQRAALALADRDHRVPPREGPRHGLGDQVAVDVQRVDLQVGNARRRRDRLGDRVLVELAPRVLGVLEIGGRDDLGRGRVVALGRLRAYRAHALLQHAAAQRGGAAGDLPSLLGSHEAGAAQHVEQLFEREGRTRLPPSRRTPLVRHTADLSAGGGRDPTPPARAHRAPAGDAQLRG
jgi:hypothetical protein